MCPTVFPRTILIIPAEGARDHASLAITKALALVCDIALVWDAGATYLLFGPFVV